jgi:hypothetical protein
MHRLFQIFTGQKSAGNESRMQESPRGRPRFVISNIILLKLYPYQQFSPKKNNQRFEQNVLNVYPIALICWNWHYQYH